MRSSDQRWMARLLWEIQNLGRPGSQRMPAAVDASGGGREGDVTAAAPAAARLRARDDPAVGSYCEILWSSTPDSR